MRERGKCYRKTKNGRYEAYISEHCKFVSLGTYDNKTDAMNSVERYKDDRLRAAVQNFGHEPEDGIIYEDRYLVFPDGDIFNLDGIKMSPSIDRCGYLHGLINGRNRSYHRIIAECFVPNPHNKLDINHINGIKTDNRAENLEWCTRSENVIHAYKTGLEQPVAGVDHHNSKLDNELVRYIRQSDKSSYKLAKELGVDSSTIRDVRNKKTWRHVI
jgi:hypothetical protein